MSNGHEIDVDLVTAMQDSKAKTRESQTGEPISGTLAAVAESCVCSWDRIVKCISLMQDELEKMYDGGSLPNGLVTAESARLRSYTTLAKRLSTLLGSAQYGFESALTIQEFVEVEKSDLSDWEKAKLRMEPDVRDWIEVTASQVMAIARERKSKKPEHDTSHSVNVPSRQSERPKSGADATGDLILQLRISEISRLEARLRQEERIVAGDVVGDGLSKGANNARFRRHVSEMKRVVGQLLSAQRGFYSALLIQKKLELKASVAAGWALEGQRHEKRLQEYSEKVMLLGHERRIIFQVLIPELDELYRQGKLANNQRKAATRVSEKSGVHDV
jgi:hypothetical protein